MPNSARGVTTGNGTCTLGPSLDTPGPALTFLLSTRLALPSRFAELHYTVQIAVLIDDVFQRSLADEQAVLLLHAFCPGIHTLSGTAMYSASTPSSSSYVKPAL